MYRVQLALNVNDIEQAVSFYTKLFGTEPAKRRPGYANFAITQPPLKLVLLENPGQGGTLNHLGVEVDSPDAVDAEQARGNVVLGGGHVEHALTSPKGYPLQQEIGKGGGAWRGVGAGDHRRRAGLHARRQDGG